MLFNTFQFWIFFLLVLLGFSILRGTGRKVFLLAASYYFYMCWNWHYIWIVIFLTLLDYCAGLQIEKSERTSQRKFWLCASLVANLGLLGVFKYFNFFSVSVAAGMGLLGFHLPPVAIALILPVGISFHTFQAMSYTIEVYRRRVPAEHNLLNYALYVAFFPQMVAGPIERPYQLLPQFHHEPKVSRERIYSGLRLALWGLFKKMVIADFLAVFVTNVYNDPPSFSNIEMFAATICFAIQIYCDFSGYSDIAVGVARIMGYDLCINFRQPYFSKSISEFWHRWHISLSTWFRDYLYIPLGGSRVQLPRLLLNILITFVVSGLWHGANWTFIAWGAFHGGCLIASRLTVDLRRTLTDISGINRFPALHSAIQTICTFACVTVGWVLFRSKDIHSAFYVLCHLIPSGSFRGSALAGLPRANVPFILFFVICMFVVEWFAIHASTRPKIWNSPTFRFGAYYSVASAIVLFGAFGHVEFIYFQF
jgi:D-alanyl-lipoteichoic acid acyltransferase DltB (MBOAT superfamily)